MNRPLRPYAFIALAAIVIGILENTFFGADHGGAKHDISVAFFFVSVIGVVGLIALGVVAVVRRTQTSKAS